MIEEVSKCEDIVLLVFDGSHPSELRFLLVVDEDNDALAIFAWANSEVFVALAENLMNSPIGVLTLQGAIESRLTCSAFVLGRIAADNALLDRFGATGGI